MKNKFGLTSRALAVGLIVFYIGCAPRPDAAAWISGTWACEGVEPVAEDKEVLRSVVMKFDSTERGYHYESFGTATLKDGEVVSGKRLVKEEGQVQLTLPEMLVRYQYRTIFDTSGKGSQVLDVEKAYQVQRNADVLMISATGAGSSNTVSYECSKTSDAV